MADFRCDGKSSRGLLATLESNTYKKEGEWTSCAPSHTHDTLQGRFYLLIQIAEFEIGKSIIDFHTIRIRANREVIAPFQHQIIGFETVTV